MKCSLTVHRDIFAVSRQRVAAVEKVTAGPVFNGEVVSVGHSFAVAVLQNFNGRGSRRYLDNVVVSVSSFLVNA